MDVYRERKWMTVMFIATSTALAPSDFILRVKSGNTWAVFLFKP